MFLQQEHCISIGFSRHLLILHFLCIERKERAEGQNSSFCFVHIFKDAFIKCSSPSVNKPHSVPHGNDIINCL